MVRAARESLRRHRRSHAHADATHAPTEELTPTSLTSSSRPLRGYEPKYRMLESAIKKLAPTAAVTGKTGRVSSFEVVVDGTVVYSKLATGAFPDFNKLAAQITQ